jgi:hypothetical protein
MIFFSRSADAPSAHQQYLQGHIPGAAFFDHQRFADKCSPYEYMLVPPAEMRRSSGNLAFRGIPKSYCMRLACSPPQPVPGGSSATRATPMCGC